MTAINNYTLWVRGRITPHQDIKGFTMVNSFEVNTDLLSAVSSEIVCDYIPNNFEVGDLCVLVDYTGYTIFNGVIDTIEDNKLVVLDLMSVFDYEIAFPKGWGWSSENTAIHARLFELAKSQLKYYQRVSQEYLYDNKQNAFFNNFRCTGEYTSEQWVFKAENNTVLNMFDEMMKIQELGYVYVNNLNLTYPNKTKGIDDDTAKITFACYEAKPNEYKTIMASNAVNVYVTQEAPQYNKISIFWETPRKNEDADIKWDRGCYYLGRGGRTADPLSPSRDKVTKNKVVFTDDASLTNVLNKEMNRQLYNHKIEISFFKDNGIYNFFEYKNGQHLKVLDGNKLWDTVKTGHTIKWDRDTGNTQYKIICGFVRNKATEFWFQKD